MSDPVFKSSLTPEEIEANFKNTDFFTGIMDGLQDALSYARGKATPETIARKRSLPEVDPFLLRSSLNMTQRAFAEVLGVSCRTVESWEAGKTSTAATAKKLMHLIQQDHSLIGKL